jgi:arylsulfatase A-like enzyme
VLFIVLDDTGFGQLGCYGSPIATPNFDALAAGGLLYTNMHTAAPGSPVAVMHHHRSQSSQPPASPRPAPYRPDLDG